MLLLLLNYVVLRALWKIDVHLISTLVNKSLYFLSLFIIIIIIISLRHTFNIVLDSDYVDTIIPGEYL